MRARVEELESELVEEQANTDHINERRLHYKERCQMSKTKLLVVEEVVEKLTAEAMKLVELKEREKQEIQEDNEKLKLESEGFEREREVFQRQREEYERLKDSELHREESVEELMEVGKKWEVTLASSSQTQYSAGISAYAACQVARNSSFLSNASFATCLRVIDR